VAERRYALRLVKPRLHQASFREVVLAAYDHRCAISNLPHDHLLDAAHIVADGRLHVSERLLMLRDGPLLEQSLKGIAGGQIRAPRRQEDRPDRDPLAARFEQSRRCLARGGARRSSFQSIGRRFFLYTSVECGLPRTLASAAPLVQVQPRQPKDRADPHWAEWSRASSVSLGDLASLAVAPAGHQERPSCAATATPGSRPR
jgi:hypothetical protein